MKDILKLLPLIYWLSVAICVLMVVVYENELLLPGWLAVDKQYDFLASTIMECLTICCIPVAFRLFKFSIPGSTIKHNAEGYVRWALVRLALFVVPMMVMNVAFGYMAIIDMLCLLLVYPTRARYLYETGQEK